LSPEAIVERERRWARPVAIVAFAGVVLSFAGLIVEQAAGLLKRDGDAARLTSFHEHSSALLGTALMSAVGAMLLAVPLAYLFTAARARRESVRPALIGFAFIGPIFLGVQAIVAWAATNSVSKDFVARHAGSGRAADKLATHLINDSGISNAAAGLLFPAILAMLIAMIYIPLQSMRAGLLPRFWATLAMAFGAVLAIIPPLGLLGIMLWLLYFGVMIGGWWPGGRPPAWDAGVAIPWPKPGDEDATTVEGRGNEVTTPAGDAAEGAEEPEESDDSRQQQRAASNRRKRKRRR
jgi:hypothetical protein